MNAYANISKELKSALEKNSVTKKLLSLDLVILFASIGLQFFFWLLNQWVSWVFVSNFISLFSTVFYYVMIAGMLLTIANRKDQLLAFGCWAYAAFQFITFLRRLLYRYAHYFSLSIFFVIILWAGLGLLAFFAANPDKMPKLNRPVHPVIPPQGGNSQWNNSQASVPPQQNAAPQWNNAPQTSVPPQQNAAPRWNNAPQTSVPPQQNAAPQWNNAPQTSVPPQQNAAPQWNTAPSQQNTAPKNVSEPKMDVASSDETVIEAPAPTERACPVCGASVPADGKFCPVCGAKM